MYVETHPKTRADVWTLSPDGEKAPFLASELVERDPVFSPEGRFIAYESNESGCFEIETASAF